jgi:hypothetical protein
MNPLLIAPLMEIGKGIISRVWPDPERQAEANRRLIELQQAGDLKQLEADLQLALGQININAAEAASEKLFKSGWRPFVGWVCGAGLLYQLLLRPVLNGMGAHMPPIEMEALNTLLFGLLGLGAYRTVEKVKRGGA